MTFTVPDWLAENLAWVIVGTGGVGFGTYLLKIRGKAKASTERRQDAGALLQVVKENTAAMVALESIQEDVKKITIATVDKLDAMGKVLAAMTTKLQDMHDDVRPHQKRHAVGGG